MPPEPSTKRTVVFVDGQNLYHAARVAFGYTYPNYDPKQLAEAACAAQGWDLRQVRFYTGIPELSDQPFWSRFWSRKLLSMSREGVWTFSRPLRYRNKRLRLPDGREITQLIGQEKGIDVRIAIDVVRLGLAEDYDVALIFSQDQDLSEVAEEIRQIACQAGRWIKIASAFPFSPTSSNRRGINKTDWIRINRTTYDTCLDPRDYRP